MIGPRWYPAGTTLKAELAAGDVYVDDDRTVWKVHEVRRTWDLTPEDEAAWVAEGAPPIEQWRNHPLRIGVEFIGGRRPAGWKLDKNRGSFVIRGHCWWKVYPHGRWPQCSCCGHPMPCPQEEADRLVEASSRELERLAAIGPEQCWSCQEVITPRQKAIVYPGENLELPSAPSPRFHLRGKCRSGATAYERKWLGADPGRERILTWPRCDGTLIVHRDGTTECGDPFNLDPAQYAQRYRLPDCTGHLTSDHPTSMSRCSAAFGEECPKNCQPVAGRVRLHPPRPELRNELTLSDDAEGMLDP